MIDKGIDVVPVLPESERRSYKVGSWGRRMSSGTKPAVVVGDVNYDFVVNKLEPVIQSIKRWRCSLASYLINLDSEMVRETGVSTSACVRPQSMGMPTTSAHSWLRKTAFTVASSRTKCTCSTCT